MGVILSLAALPSTELTNIGALLNEITYELDVSIELPSTPMLEGTSSELAARWQQFKDTVLTGTIPRWVKEMVAVSVARALGSVPMQQMFTHSLAAQGIHAAWLGELQATELDPTLLPDEIQSVVTFARIAASNGHADVADAAILRESGFSDDEIGEVVAATALFMGACRWLTNHLDLFGAPQALETTA